MTNIEIISNYINNNLDNIINNKSLDALLEKEYSAFKEVGLDDFALFADIKNKETNGEEYALSDLIAKHSNSNVNIISADNEIKNPDDEFLIDFITYNIKLFKDEITAEELENKFPVQEVLAVCDRIGVKLPALMMSLKMFLEINPDHDLTPEEFLTATKEGAKRSAKTKESGGDVLENFKSILGRIFGDENVGVGKIDLNDDGDDDKECDCPSCIKTKGIVQDVLSSLDLGETLYSRVYHLHTVNGPVKLELVLNKEQNKMSIYKDGILTKELEVECLEHFDHLVEKIMKAIAEFEE